LCRTVLGQPIGWKAYAGRIFSEERQFHTDWGEISNLRRPVNEAQQKWLTVSHFNI